MSAAIDLDLARNNLIEQQIRPWDVHDPRVLETLAAIPREAFVPADQSDLAFMDIDLPLVHGQTMLSPKIQARLLQAVALQPDDTVLEIGTGNGYLTACLADLAAAVHSVELHSDLLAGAEQNLKSLGINNVTLWQGDAARGWSQGPAQYDAIVVTASLPAYDNCFETLLKPGGRLCVVVGKAPAMQAMKITRLGEHGYSRESLFETVVAPLIGREPVESFRF